MNKKGVTFSGWIEGILITILFVTILSVVISGMNTIYGTDHQITGLETNATESFGEYAGTGKADIEGGDVEESEAESGLTFRDSWKIGKATFKVIGSFFTGKFIETAFKYMRFNASVGLVVRLLYIISLILLGLRLWFKVKP